MDFNKALETARQIAVDHVGELDTDIVLVRDLFGRIRALLDHLPKGKKEKDATKSFAKALSSGLGNYGYPQRDTLIYRSNLEGLCLPEEYQASVLATQDGHEIRLHDRLLTGSEWHAEPMREPQRPKRFTFFSIKGGVGRSTTAIILARHLARLGKRVLIVDLDLESPGVGSSLLPEEQLPEYGVVDWFVEDALGNAAAIRDQMVASSRLADDLPGEILVAPSYGRRTGDYLPKLGRCYLERGPNGPEQWTHRLQRLIELHEASHQPDIVLLDSRTGLHDSSAALVLAMGAQTLLFAVESRQTWKVYGFLFGHWRQHPSVRDLRDKLWIVAGMVPETDRESYLDKLTEHSWNLFMENLYDEAPPDTEDVPTEGFTFDLKEEAAPHTPRPVFWHRGLQTFDPSSSLDVQMADAAYGAFLTWFDQAFLPEDELRGHRTIHSRRRSEGRFSMPCRPIPRCTVALRSRASPICPPRTQRRSGPTRCWSKACEVRARASGGRHCSRRIIGS